MKNQNTSGSTNPQDESIWQFVKPVNTWTPNTDVAWQKVSLNLGASAVSASLLSTTRLKTIAKFTVKKLLLWGAVGASVTAGIVYQVKQYRKKPVLTVTANASPKAVVKLPVSIDKMAENASDVTFFASPKSAKTISPRVGVVQKTSKNNPSLNSKILKFKQAELQVVAEILSQTYGVSIKIERPQLLHCKLTATFENEPIQNILEIIQETFNMEIVTEKETIWLKGGSCE